MGTDDVEETRSDNVAMDEPTNEVVEGNISSLNALAGQGNPCSLVFWVKLLLIVFTFSLTAAAPIISSNLVSCLKFPIQPTSKFRVYIGNGDFLLCQHACLQVELLMQGTVFKVDLYVLPIEGSEYDGFNNWVGSHMIILR